jgi:uracil-DNA glycosylase family 4
MALLAGAGIARERVFITNAVLCNPRDAKGRNDMPAAPEIARCRPFLEETLRLVDAPVVVTLGRIALASLDRIATHGLTLRHDVGRAAAWAGRTLVPLYHPGPRAQIHRSFDKQQADFIALARLIRGGP